MAPKKKKDTTPFPPEHTEAHSEVVTPEEMAAAATNDPALSSDEFTLGGRTFKIVDLSYNDYVKFLVKVKPLLDVFAAFFAKKQNVGVPGIELPNPTNLSTEVLLGYCLEDLPELARLCCVGTDPDITVEEVKELAGDPFTLAEIVLKQIVRNRMIQKFSSFFVHLLPLMKMRQPQK